MNPLGLFLNPRKGLFLRLHTVYMAYFERLPTRLNPLAERTCFSQVDGFMLFDLAERDNLAELEITSLIHQSKVRGALARLGRKRPAEAAGGGTDVPRAKRSRLQLEADATPGPAAAAAEPVEMFKHGELFYEAKPSEELKCALCLEEIAEQPAALRCGHIFGRGCLLAALAANRWCPTCRAVAGGAATDAVDTLVTPQHTVASLIDELRVRCPHGVVQHPGGGADDWIVAADGCDAVVPRGQLAAHTVTCPFEPFGCAQAGHGCGWRGARRGLAEHADSCWYERRHRGQRAAGEARQVQRDLRADGERSAACRPSRAWAASTSTTTRRTTAPGTSTTSRTAPATPCSPRAPARSRSARAPGKPGTARPSPPPPS